MKKPNPILVALVMLGATTAPAAMLETQLRDTAINNPFAEAYLTTQSVTNFDARERIDQFFTELKAGGLMAGLVDGAFFEPDLNPSLKSFRNQAGTNTVGITRDRTGAHMLGETNRSEWPISTMTGWTNTIVVDYIGHTNSIGDTFALWGLYNAQDDYLLAYNSKLQTRTGATFTDLGGVRDPYSDGIVFMDERERVQASTYDNTTHWRIYVDSLVTVNVASNALTVLTNVPSRFVLGQRWNGGSTFDLGAYLTVRAFVIFDRVLTTNELYTVQRAMRNIHPARVNRVGIGDSTVGPSDTYPAGSFLSLWQAKADQINDTYVYNHGWSGITAATLIDQMTWRLRPFRPYGRAQSGVADIVAGINDIGGGSTGAAAFLSYSNLCHQAKTNGFLVNAYTIQFINTNQASGWTAAMEVQRTNFNNYLLASTNAHLFNRLIRRDLLFTTTEGDTNHVPQYTYDGLHPTVLGNARIANDLIGNEERTILAAGSGINLSTNNRQVTIIATNFQSATFNAGIYLNTNTVTNITAATFTVPGNVSGVLVSGNSDTTITLNQDSVTNGHWFFVKAYSTNLNMIVTVTNTVGFIDKVTNSITFSNFTSRDFVGDTITHSNVVIR